jgi:hypothetical protein
MTNRNLTQDELKLANDLLTQIREQLTALSGDDPDLLFAYRRKVAKQLIYDERSTPAHRRKLKALKRKDQDICPDCREPLPEKYAVLDRKNASYGYTDSNTELICPGCDRKRQTAKRYT